MWCYWKDQVNLPSVLENQVKMKSMYLLKRVSENLKKKCVTGFNDTNSSQMQLFKFESCSQKSTWYIDPNALCKYLSTCEWRTEQVARTDEVLIEKNCWRQLFVLKILLDILFFSSTLKGLSYLTLLEAST